MSVVLVEPQYPGNVGAVARALLNFGVERLVLVNPCPITNEARDRAVHAQRVLDEAVVVADFRDAYDRFDYVAAFSTRVTARDRSHVRVPVALRDAAESVAALDGEVALVFGREDDGLRNEEVEEADIVVQIPTSPLYASMNLSHAVAVALYEFYHAPEVVERVETATHREKEVLFQYYRALLGAIQTKPHKMDIYENMFRRVVGRARLSRWEFHRLMGVLSGSMKGLGHWPPKDLPPLPAEVEEEGPPGDAEAPPGGDAAGKEPGR